MILGEVGFYGAWCEVHYAYVEGFALHVEDLGEGVEGGFGGAVYAVPRCWAIMIHFAYTLCILGLLRIDVHFPND